MRSSRIPIAVNFTPYGAKNRHRFTMTPTWLNLEYMDFIVSHVSAIYMALYGMTPISLSDLYG
jgi:hypothetical protein